MSAAFQRHKMATKQEPYQETKKHHLLCAAPYLSVTIGQLIWESVCQDYIEGSLLFQGECEGLLLIHNASLLYKVLLGKCVQIM